MRHVVDYTSGSGVEAANASPMTCGDFKDRASTCSMHCDEDYYLSNPYDEAGTMSEEDKSDGIRTIFDLCETGCLHACHAECEVACRWVDTSPQGEDTLLENCKSHNCADIGDYTGVDWMGFMTWNIDNGWSNFESCPKTSISLFKSSF